MRIGQGYDVHAFTNGDYLTIGGVRIEHSKAFLAHSDGDVLLHAITDALLGAAGLGDIGTHFPDTDAAYKNIDSRVLLRNSVQLLSEAGFVCGNIDATIIAQAPKMAPHIPAMRECIAEDLKLNGTCINIKATTTEQLGFCGREEGIAALAVALLLPID